VSVSLPEDGGSSLPPKRLPDYLASLVMIPAVKIPNLPCADSFMYCATCSRTVMYLSYPMRRFQFVYAWTNGCTVHALQTCNYISDIIPGSSHERVITSIVPHLWQRRQYFPPVYGWSAESNILLL